MTDAFIRPDVKQFLDYLNNVPGPKMHELGADEARRMMVTMRGVADVPPGDVAVTRNLTMPGPHGGEIGLRLYDPRENRVPGPAIVFFHGGGFVLGDLDTHDTPCRSLCRDAQVHVLSVDYRLAPEHRFPAAVHDAQAKADSRPI